MAVTSQKGAPALNDIALGKFALVRIIRTEASVAAPVTAIEIEGVQSFEVGAAEWGYTKRIHQFGGGSKYAEKKSDPKWSGSLTFLNAEAGNQIADMLGLTWTTAGSVILPSYENNDYPDFILEVIARDDDNTTHLYSMVVPDVVINDWAVSMSLEDTDFTLPFHTREFPFKLCSGAEIVYDEYTGTGSTTAFTLSSTPLTLATASTYRLMYYDELYYVKEKASTASTGTHFTSGYSNTTVTLTATSAPALGTVVQVLYAKSTA